jgi:hypothetical protein
MKTLIFKQLTYLKTMKKYLLLSLFSLAYLSGNAQTTFVYSGSATNNFLAGGPAKISALGNNTTIFLSPSFYHIGLAGVANNGFLGNIGVFGTTKQNTISAASNHFAIYGDNSSNNINANNINVTGGFFTAKNIGTGTIVTGVSANSTGLNNSSTTYGVNAIATNNSNIIANNTIAVRGITNSGQSTVIDVDKDVANPGGYFSSNDGQGIYATTTGAFRISGSVNYSHAITGYSNISNIWKNVGVVGTAEGTGHFKMGVHGVVDGSPAIDLSSGIWGTDKINASNTYAGYFDGKVYMSGNVGIGTTPTLNSDERVDINGRLRIRSTTSTAGVWFNNAANNIASANGAFYGMKADTETGIWINDAWRFWVNSSGNATLLGTLTQSSDRRLKKDFESLTHSLSSIYQLQGYHYKWIETSRSQDLQTGLIAQEVQKIFPELVQTDEKGFLSVNYIGLIPHLIEAVKELRNENKDLKNINQKLENRLDKIEALLSASNPLTGK